MSWCEIEPDPHAPIKVLVLQGGGALGSYQAGVFEALDAACFCPQWVAGISIGAINGAIIAGNRPEHRLDRLREFWTLVTSGLPFETPTFESSGLATSWQQTAAAFTAMGGAPGFFRPLWPPAMPWLRGPLAWYDTSPLRDTLERLVDWDLLNAGHVRLSVGAVNVETGNFRYFDTAHERLGPEHVMASGALPPGLPPVKIDGQWWWDGGLVSNTPLDHVLESEAAQDMLVLQVDLFPASGPLPESIAEVEERVLDIRFSSRTRLNTDANVRLAAVRQAFWRLVEQLPDDLKASADVEVLKAAARQNRVAIGQLIYRNRAGSGKTRGREFSRTTMHAHWEAGRTAVEGCIGAAVRLLEAMPDGVTSHDLTRLSLKETTE